MHPDPADGGSRWRSATPAREVRALGVDDVAQTAPVI
jgi:hypothetical protein